MSTVVRCPGCQKQLRIPVDPTGRQGRCPQCQTAIQIPASTASAMPDPPRLSRKGWRGRGVLIAAAAVALVVVLAGGWAIRHWAFRATHSPGTGAQVVSRQPSTTAAPPAPGMLSASEKAEGWQLLFDGKTTAGWTAPQETKISNGEIVVVAGAKQLLLYTEAEFTTYEVRYDFRVEGKGPITFLMHVGGKDATGTGIGYGGAGPPTNGRSWCSCSVRLEYDGKTKMAMMKQISSDGGGLTSGPYGVKPDPEHIGFLVPEGTTLFLRNIRIKPLAAE